MRALLAGVRFNLPGFPRDLVPIEWLPERQLACVRVSDRIADPPVVLVDPTTRRRGPPLSQRQARSPNTHTSFFPKPMTFAAFNISWPIRRRRSPAVAAPRISCRARTTGGCTGFAPRTSSSRCRCWKFDRDRNALAVAACPITRSDTTRPGRSGAGGMHLAAVGGLPCRRVT